MVVVLTGANHVSQSVQDCRGWCLAAGSPVKEQGGAGIHGATLWATFLHLHMQ